MTNLRREIAGYVARAIDSTVNYSGDEAEQNKHNWIQITTDRILGAVVRDLPEPVDLPDKYEITDSKGVYVRLSQDLEPKDLDQLAYISRFADDQGYNRYYSTLMRKYTGLYNLPNNGVSSGHGDKERHNSPDPTAPADKE